MAYTIQKSLVFAYNSKVFIYELLKNLLQKSSLIYPLNPDLSLQIHMLMFYAFF